MKSRLLCLVASCILFIGNPSFSQTDLSKIIPPSPTAASLGKYGDFPVSTYTGTPNISIPIYEIKDKGLVVPISLSYHASGIKVEEEASWVGLGWSLSAGGVITRSVRGVDDLVSDLSAFGYPETPLPTSIDATGEYVPPAGHPDELYFRQVCGGYKDAEPDIYYFNFLGKSGKFVFKQNATNQEPFTVQLSSQEKIKIYYNGNPVDQRWTITTADGYKYLFGTTEKSRSSTIGWLPPGNPNATFIDPRTIVSSWYLDEIIGPRGEHIVFKYTQPSQNGNKRIVSVLDSRRILVRADPAPGSSGCASPGALNTGHNWTATLNVSFDVYLKEITFPNGKVEFITSARTDIEPYSDNATPVTSLPQKLDRIVISKIEEGVAIPLKRIELGYDYFNNPYATNQYANKRLRLETVTERSDNIAKGPYRFEYTMGGYAGSDQLPAKDSWSKDHWGYFNNQPNQRVPDYASVYLSIPTLIPQQFYKNATGANVSVAGANREPDAQYIMAGTLKKIQYPTGGTTEFIFEPNDYQTSELVTNYRHEVVFAYGPQVLDPDQGYEDVKQFTISKESMVKLSASVFVPGENYCNNDPNWSVVAGGIRSIGNTPSFSFVLTTKIGCTPNGNYERYFLLPAGTYEIQAVFNTADMESYVRVDIEEATNQTLKKKIGGGIRIAKTIAYDGISHSNDIVKKYTYENSAGFSTGIQMAPLLYGSKITFTRVFDRVSESGSCYSAWNIEMLDLAAESNIPLGTSAMGNPIGYSQVTVWQGENGENGKTEYTYWNARDEVIMVKMPTIPHPENGFLLNAKDYKWKSANNSFQLVKETIRELENELGEQRSVKGMKCYLCEIVYEGNAAITYPYIKFYNVYSNWVHVKSETVRTYDQNDESKYLEDFTEYVYGNPKHLQLTKQIQTKSDGSKLITEYTYPADYTQVNTGTIASMKDDDYYQHNYIIEKIFKVERGTDTKVVGAAFTKYGSSGWGNIVPVEEYELDIKTPKINFISSLASGTPADDAYRLKQTMQYEGDNINEIQKKDNVTTSYLWWHNNSLPVAEVINAPVANIAYTSFEPDDPIEWDHGSNPTIHTTTAAITGKNTFSGTASRQMPTGNYRVTVWCTPSGSVTVNGLPGTVLNNDGKNGWKLYQWDLTGVSTVSVSGTEIDEIRVYPPDAQMTTFTYDPLIGVTSQCDAANRVVYYLYDDLFRLTAIKDMKGNIIKTFRYNYKQ